ncbi:sulfotransferase [Salinibacter ruber]|uniref:sulfotransferase n=1 Tax=Salinibacter ruber TaxID=146919 RepID=UPI00216814BD|nr:hypothetical protein [Salinibacter ruber]
MDDLSILYIAGYGRSGSTVLDVLLSGHPRVASVGELVFLGNDWQDEDRKCACGEPYENCLFWEGLFKDEGEVDSLEQIVRDVEHRHVLPKLLLGAHSEEKKREYRRRTRRLFEYISQQGRADLVVDSSKSARQAAGRFWALKNIAGLDVRVLHLVRDGRAALRSVVEKGSNWALEGHIEEKRWLGARTTMGWVLANAIAWGLGRSLGNDLYHRVKFEDLLRAPEETLREIGGFVGVGLEPVIQRVARDEVFEVGHNVGGNRIRHKQQIHLRKTDTPNPHPWSGLDRHHQILFATLGQWMNQKLGYSW